MKKHPKIIILVLYFSVFLKIENSCIYNYNGSNNVDVVFDSGTGYSQGVGDTPSALPNGQKNCGPHNTPWKNGWFKVVSKHRYKKGGYFEGGNKIENISIGSGDWINAKVKLKENYYYTLTDFGSSVTYTCDVYDLWYTVNNGKKYTSPSQTMALCSKN